MLLPETLQPRVTAMEIFFFFHLLSRSMIPLIAIFHSILSMITAISRFRHHYGFNQTRELFLMEIGKASLIITSLLNSHPTKFTLTLDGYVAMFLIWAKLQSRITHITPFLMLR